MFFGCHQPRVRDISKRIFTLSLLFALPPPCARSLGERGADAMSAQRAITLRLYPFPCLSALRVATPPPFPLPPTPARHAISKGERRQWHTHSDQSVPSGEGSPIIFKDLRLIYLFSRSANVAPIAPPHLPDLASICADLHHASACLHVNGARVPLDLRVRQPHLEPRLLLR